MIRRASLTALAVCAAASSAFAQTAIVDSSWWASELGTQAADTIKQAPARAGYIEASAHALSVYKQIAKHDPRGGGLGDPKEADQARLGEPLPIFWVRADSLATFGKASKANALLLTTNRLYVPVLVRNQSRTSLMIAQTGSEWSLAGFGEGPSALVVDAAIKRLGPAKKGEFRFLVQIGALQSSYWLGRRTDGRNVQEEGADGAVELIALKDAPAYKVSAGERGAAYAWFSRLAPHAAAAVKWSKDVGGRDSTPPGPRFLGPVGP